MAFNFKTPGREDDDLDENTVTLSNNNYTAVAAIILEGLGGKNNITSIDNCITRLRLEIKDYTLVDEKKIKSSGVGRYHQARQNQCTGYCRTSGTVCGR